MAASESILYHARRRVKMSVSYDEAMLEAIRLNDRKNQIGTELVRKIGPLSTKHSPYSSVSAIAKSYILSGCKLSGQIIDAARIGHLLLGIIGMRPLLEMMINSTYIFNNPKHKRDKGHMRKVCRDILRTTNQKRGRVVHSRINGKGVEGRAKEAGLLKLYKTNYRGLSDWCHLTIRTPYISGQEPGEKFGKALAGQALSTSHDILSSICEGLNYSLDPAWTTEVVAFNDKFAQE